MKMFSTQENIMAETLDNGFATDGDVDQFLEAFKQGGKIYRRWFSKGCQMIAKRIIKKNKGFYADKFLKINPALTGITKEALQAWFQGYTGYEKSPTGNWTLNDDLADDRDDFQEDYPNPRAFLDDFKEAKKLAQEQKKQEQEEKVAQELEALQEKADQDREEGKPVPLELVNDSLKAVLEEIAKAAQGKDAALVEQAKQAFLDSLLVNDVGPSRKVQRQSRKMAVNQ